MLRFLYQKILKPILFLFDPEAVHHLFVRVGELLGKTRAGQKLVGAFYGYRGPDVSRVVDDVTYRTPIMLAAGFDYNARLTQILGSVAFGGVEVGSVTARPCPGNEPPRMARAVKSKSLVVYKGLKNDGVEAIIARIRQRPPQEGLVLGISVAMTNDEGCATTEGAIEDYYTSLKSLVEADLGDYYTINISCPNVHGGENFTDPGRLRELLSRLQEIDAGRPVYVKLAINLEEEIFDELLEIVEEFGLHGVVIGNLNKDYDTLDVREEAPAEYRGGLSGKPCRDPSTALIARARAKLGPEKTIIGCGGILSPADALEKIDAGADLLQLISGMIFEGPHLMREISAALARRQRALPANEGPEKEAE